MNLPVASVANLSFSQQFGWRPLAPSQMTGGTQDTHSYSQSLTYGVGANNVNAAPDPSVPLTLVGTAPQSVNVLTVMQAATGNSGAAVLKTLLVTNDSGTGSVTLTGSLATALGLSGQVLGPGEAIARTWAGAALATSTADVLTFTPTANCTVTLSYAGVVSP